MNLVIYLSLSLSISLFLSLSLSLSLSHSLSLPLSLSRTLSLLPLPPSPHLLSPSLYPLPPLTPGAMQVPKDEFVDVLRAAYDLITLGATVSM